MLRLIDGAVLWLVRGWIIRRARPQWRELRKRMRKCNVHDLDVAVPRFGDEKFLWRKIFDHNPLFVTLTDKIACKEWIAERGFDVKMPATLWVGTDANEIPEELWHKPIYIKASHGYQMNIPVLSPPADRSSIVEQANAFLKREHGREAYQWAYRKIKPRLLVEEALFPDQPLIEIKYYTFGSIVEQFNIRRHGNPGSAARFLRQLEGGYERDTKPALTSPNIDTRPLPIAAEIGLKIAGEIGSEFDFLRIDIMTDGKIVYLGEITVYNQAGRFHLNGHILDAAVNRSWDLRKSWFMNAPQRGVWRLYVAALRRILEQQEAANALQK